MESLLQRNKLLLHNVDVPFVAVKAQPSEQCELVLKELCILQKKKK